MWAEACVFSCENGVGITKEIIGICCRVYVKLTKGNKESLQGLLIKSYLVLG